MNGGIEWIVDVAGCDPARIAGDPGLAGLRALFAELVRELDLHPLGDTQWHRFPQTDGLTGLVALSESHLACHTYPEAGGVTLNLYTCRARPAPDWAALFARHVGPCEVHTRTAIRGIDVRTPETAP
jgi:S-adenosylmethionine decarboxylase